MQIQLNDSDGITGFSMIGKLDNGVDYSGEMPDGFEENFKPSFYLLKNNEIVINQDYQEPIIVDPGPSEAQKHLAQVTYQQMMTTQNVTTLQIQNAQMAYQLMMQQQGGEA